MDRDMTVRVLGRVVDDNFSGHIPVQLVMGARRERPSGRTPVQSWVARSPRFVHWVTVFTQRMLPEGLSVFDELSAMISIFHCAAGALREEAVIGRAGSAEEQAHWVIVAMRAWRAGDAAGVRRAARAVPALSDCIVSGSIDAGKARRLLT